MDIRARGITRRPVPLRFVLKCKRHPDGSYDKHRARLVICGHKGFMPKHEYKDTFAASPDIEDIQALKASGERPGRGSGLGFRFLKAFRPPSAF